MKKDAIKSLWRECFADSDSYVDMYFAQVYRDDDALTIEEEGRVVSSLLLQRHAMNFHGAALPVSYLCGAATTRTMRRHGLMAELMGKALRESYSRGDMLCSLIPASDWLFRYYERFGFSPAFYICLERYSSAHPFTHGGIFTAADATNSDDDYAFFDTRMAERPCCVQHSREQYRQILLDNEADGGRVVKALDPDGRVTAMAFAVPHEDDSEVVVKEVLAVDEDSRTAVLRMVHDAFPGKQLAVYGYLNSPTGVMMARGMVRIVNVMSCLKAIAASDRRLSLHIRVKDPIISENNHIYRVQHGEAVIDDSFSGRLDYDVDTEVLASIVFGSPVTAQLLSFPSLRPFISLMLD